MANDNEHNDTLQKLDVPKDLLASMDASVLGTRGAARRRFARAGAGATGVALTLVSQPGMACSVCRAPSGYQSVLTATANNKTNAVISIKPVKGVTCAGLPPSSWYPIADSACKAGGSSNAWATARFGSYFTCTGTYAAVGDATALKLLSLSQASRSQLMASSEPALLAMWLTAAMLNLQTGRSSFLTEEILHNIWNGYTSKKGYTPAAAVKAWFYSDMVIYLSGTMD